MYPSDFQPRLEATTVWSFPNRGRWATHRGDYPGNWAPQVPRNLILRYSRPGETVLDPFVGGGTTIIECKLLCRRGLGIDINPRAVELARRRLNFTVHRGIEQEVLVGDARRIPRRSSSVDLICAHPPYADAIRYSRSIKGDLSLIPDIDLFMREIGHVAAELWRVLKLGRICAVQMGDIRRRRHVIPLGFLTMRAFLNVGFTLREIVIKVQHNCASTRHWLSRISRENFLLIMHEYIFIFEKV